MTETETQPPRKERRWLRRLLIVLGVIVLLVGIAVLAYAIWRGKEHAQLVRRINAIRAAGEPIELVDLREPDVRDEQNIVPLLREAADALVVDSEHQRKETDFYNDDEHAFEFPMTAAERQFVQETITANAAALRILAPIDARTGVAWKDDYAVKQPFGVDPILNKARGLANLLSDAARLAASDGKWNEVLDHAIDIDTIGDAFGRKPSIIGFLISAGIHALAADVVQRHASELRIGEGPGEVPRVQVLRVIRLLLDDSKISDSLRDDLMGERVFVHDMFKSGAFGTMTVPAAANPAGVAIGPFKDRNEAAILDYFAASLRLGDARSHAEFKDRSGELDDIMKNVEGSTTLILARILLPSLARVYDVKFYLLNDRRRAATALAIRLYAADHDGKRPQTLTELVPTYLPAVPIDAIDGQPLRYDPKRAIVWDVGHNSKDDNGDERPINGRATGAPLDNVVHLDTQPRPATRPAE